MKKVMLNMSFFRRGETVTLCMILLPKKKAEARR